MADTTIPGEIAVDIRQPVVGDSFNWEAVEPLAAKKSIVIHATASEAPNEDGFVIADYHVNHNGWGGCGVHLVCTKDEYEGKPQFGLPPGAGLQYVGDLATWRAGTVNQNPGRIHIEISGLFTPGHGIPSANQLRKVRAFIDWALSPNEVLPSLNFYSQVTFHNNVPGQNTECPGWQHPSFGAWFAYLQGGPFPDALYGTQPENPPLPTQQPVAPTEPGQGAGTPIPVTVEPPTTSTIEVILREGAYVVDYTTGTRLKDLPLNTPVNVAQTVTTGTGVFARTVWAVANNKTNGVPVEFLQSPTGQPSGTIPISTPEVATPAPNPLLVGDAVATNVTDAQLKEATVPFVDKRSALEIIKELFAELFAWALRRKKH